MSETETAVLMDDKALFDAATSDAAPATEATTQEVTTEQAEAGPARDEHGRFAPKVEAEAAAEVVAEQPKPVDQPPAVEAKQEPPPGWIPAWRAREIADARVRDLEQRLRQAEKPAEPIDPYVDPEKFRDAGVRQAVDPIAKQLADTREYFSRKTAIATHGLETVQEAYKWLETATHAGDPKVGPLLQRITASIDPFDEVVTAFKRDKALSTVGDDPHAWMQKQLQEAAKDPAKRQELMQMLGGDQSQQQQQNGAAPATNVVKLPPSLNRQPGTAGNATPGTMDDKDLYAFATR
jgi:hypothetical protein